jgi:hypothetical protein
MKDLKTQERPDGRQALAFTVEAKAFETFDQYKTGAELKELAGIPLNTELFLAVEEDYEPELIGNDTPVDLARKDVEHFFVKAKLKFTINGVPFISYDQCILGKTIRELGKIPADHDILLKIEQPFKDELVADEEEVDLARPGKEHFISKPVSITLIVNARAKTWGKRTISFEEVVVLAFGSFDPNPNRVYTVTYSGGVHPKPEGTMVKGQIINIKDKTNFDVSATDKS